MSSFDHEPAERPSASGGVPVWVWFAVLNALALMTAVGVGAWFLVRMQRDAQRPPAVAPPIQARQTEPASRETRPAAPVDNPSIIDPGRVVADVKLGVVHLSPKNANGDSLGFGSGFLIDSTGLVATNYHVLRGASSADAAFYEGKKVAVKGIRGWDADADLAIVQLAEVPDQIQTLRLASKPPLADASAVIAIGHPRGFRFTTTTGIVSGVHTTADLPANYRDLIDAPADHIWIQTNAAISGGSSGGPLLNSSGEVVGLNTWIVPGENLGFAVDARHLDSLRRSLKPEALPLADVTGPEETVARAYSEFENQFGWFATQYAAAKGATERKALVASRHPSPDFARQLWDLADRHRAVPAGYKALLGVCNVAASVEAPESCGELIERAGERILAEHAIDRRLVQVATAVSGSSHANARALLRKIVDAASEPRSKALALYALASSLQPREESEPVPDEAIAALERIVNEFDGAEYNGRSLSQLAADQLFVAKHLSVGRKAMSLEGRDADGKPMKLSDFKGKVVVLDFWADWCPHCVSMYPLERKLVRDLKDRPFALLGINCDAPGRLERLIQDKTITWRNWVDGTEGPICQQWRANSIPTIYVLDHEGVIRYRNVRDQELERAVRTLLAKVPKDAAAPAEAEVPQ